MERKQINNLSEQMLMFERLFDKFVLNLHCTEMIILHILKADAVLFHKHNLYYFTTLIVIRNL